MRLLKKIINFLWPKCPSGMNHGVKLCVVTNVLGNKYCWHHECVLENNKVCELLRHEQEEHQRKLERVKIAQEVWEKFIEEQRPFLEEHLK